MDSKAFLDNYKRIYDEYIGFIENGINKNVIKADEIVNDYLNELATGNYSLKSYKAKIIRNEQEHLQNSQDINESSDVFLNNVNELYDYFFKEYLKESKTTSYVYKDRDLKTILSELKKEKQEYLIKRTTQEKEIQSKEKEFENTLDELTNLYNGKLDAIKEKLYNDLADNKDDYMHSYLEDEQKLLDVDEKALIKEIKKNIKEKIIKGLEKEYEYKHSACENLEVIETEFNEKLETAHIEYNKQLYERYKLVNSLDLKLDEIDLKIEEKEKLYDEDYVINISNKLHNYQKKFSELCLLHCNEINNVTEEDNNKLFVYNLALIYYYNIINKLINDNYYDEFVVIIDSIIDELNTNLIKYLELIKKLNDEEANKKNLLKSKLEVIYDRQGKDLFIDNVITSLGRFYSNLYKQMNLFYMTYAKTQTIVSFGIINKYNEIIDKKIVEVKNKYLLNKVNYSLFDLDYMNFDSDLTGMNEVQKSIRNELIELNKLNEEKNQNIVKEYESKKNIIKNNYALKVQNVRNTHKDSDNNITNELAKKIETIKKEYKTKLNNIKKSTRNRISNAEKLLKESKKYLS